MQQLLLSGGPQNCSLNLQIRDYREDKDIQEFIGSQGMPGNASFNRSRRKQEVDEFVQTSRVHRRRNLSEQDVADVLKRKFERERVRKQVQPNVALQTISEFLDDKYAEFVINSEATVEMEHVEEQKRKAEEKLAREQMQRRKAYLAIAQSMPSKGAMEVRKMSPRQRPSGSPAALSPRRLDFSGSQVDRARYSGRCRYYRQQYLLLRARAQHEKLMDLSRVQRPAENYVTLLDLVRLHGGVGPTPIQEPFKTSLMEFCVTCTGAVRLSDQYQAVYREVDRMMESVVIQLK